MFDYYHNYGFPILLYALFFSLHIISIITIMVIKIIDIIRIIDIIVVIYICSPPAHSSGIWLQILGLTAGMHLYTCEEAIAAKILRNPGGRCTSVLAGTRKKQAFNTVFDHPQVHELDATEPHIWPNVYLADALPREPIRIVRAPPEQTVAWPKDGDVTCSHGTIRPAGSRATIPCDLLHVTGPSQCPRVDEPHSASVARTWSAVAGSARKGVAHAVRNSTGVPDRHQGKFTQDILNGNDIQDRFPVVKLVYHTRSNRRQPS